MKSVRHYVSTKHIKSNYRSAFIGSILNFTILIFGFIAGNVFERFGAREEIQEKFFCLSFGSKKHLSFGLRFPTLRKS